MSLAAQLHPDLTEIALVWSHTGSGEFPYAAEVGGRRFTIRINDFPAEPMYTLISEGVELQDLEDWPTPWAMPDPPKELLDRLEPRDQRLAHANMSPLLRLSHMLEERGVPLMPALQAIELSGRKHVTVAVSALYPRVTLLLPYSFDLLEAVAPGVSVGMLPARPMLKLSIDGDRIEVALVTVGPAPASEAVLVAPPGSRAAWLDIVMEMLAVAPGRITSRMRSLTHERATIGMFYDRRAPEVDAQLMMGIDQLAARLGVSREHRELWKKTHQAMGGGPVTVTTACTIDGPAPELTFLYRDADWNEAVDLCKRVTSLEVARGGAAMLGSIAGILQLEETEGTQLAFAAGAPDVAVWLLPVVRRD